LLIKSALVGDFVQKMSCLVLPCLKEQYCSVSTVKTKADEIALKMGIDFKCSSGLLQQFKER
jgi:hypothetical protein